MEFEFDPAKSQANLKKHGIDFIEAQQLWQEDNRLQIRARSDDEPRFALIARHRGKIWIAFCTMHEERVRIISVRRAREREERLCHES